MKKFNLFYLTPLMALLLYGCAQTDEDIFRANIEAEQKHNNIQSSNPYRISLNKALSTADMVLAGIEGQSTRASRAVRTVSYITETKTRSVNPDTLLYIVNYENNKGFAILGADIRANPVYCISEEGSLDLNDTVRNKGLAMLYNDYVADAQSATSVTLPPIINDSLKPVNPMPDPIIPDLGDRVITYTQITKPKLSKYASRWGQDRPYNAKCFADSTNSGKLNYVGCTPLACAQIMSFFKWPTSYNGIEIEWDKVDIWPEMFYEYYCPFGLIDFLNIIGKTLHAQPQNDGSQIVTSDNFIKYFPLFGYETVGKPQKLNGVTAAKIIDEHPILVQGRIINPDGSINTLGHTWVIDGYLSYKEEWNAIVNPGKPNSNVNYYSFYHCVWGWDGDNNGYFSCANDKTETITNRFDENDSQNNNEIADEYKFTRLEFWGNFKPVK